MSSSDERQKRPDTGKPFMHFVHECCREWGAEETSALLQMISASLPPAPIDNFEDIMPEFTRRCTWYHYEALADPADESVVH